MEEQKINFETAKLAKEKGFDVKVWDYFKITTISEKIIEDCVLNKQNFNNISDSLFNRPTQSLLQKWLREVHYIHIVIQDGFDTEKLQMSYYPVLYPFIKNKDKDEGYEYLGDVWKNSYEEALEIGLQEALKLIKNERNKRNML